MDAADEPTLSLERDRALPSGRIALAVAILGRQGSEDAPIVSCRYLEGSQGAVLLSMGPAPPIVSMLCVAESFVAQMPDAGGIPSLARVVCTTNATSSRNFSSVTEVRALNVAK